MVQEVGSPQDGDAEVSMEEVLVVVGLIYTKERLPHTFSWHQGEGESQVHSSESLKTPSTFAKEISLPETNNTIVPENQ